MSLSRLVVLASAVAVGASCSTAGGMITPFDGRTLVDLEAPLVIIGGAVEIPPNYPVGDLISVVDLEDGGFVEGQVVVRDLDVSFHPTGGWREGRRYAWTFADPEHMPHGPELPVPEALRGTAVFSTADAPEVVAVALEGGEACLVLSQPVEDIDALDVRITLDDAEVPDAAFELRDDWDGYGGGATAACLSGVDVVDVEAVRAWIGDRGPWRHPIEASGDIRARLFREELNQ